MGVMMLAKRAKIHLWFELITPYGLILTAQKIKRALKLLIAR
jgi:hypothetical protein